jgi:SET domain-containing protein
MSIDKFWGIKNEVQIKEKWNFYPKLNQIETKLIKPSKHGNQFFYERREKMKVPNEAEQNHLQPGRHKLSLQKKTKHVKNAIMFNSLSIKDMYIQSPDIG